MHDPHLKHKVFGSMTAAACFLMCFMAFIVGKSNVDLAENKGNQIKQAVGIMRERLHLCKSETLEMMANKDKVASDSESQAKLKLSNELLERENALLMNIYKDLLSNTAECESEQKREAEHRSMEDTTVEQVIDRLSFENTQLESNKQQIKQQSKEEALLKRRFIAAMRLENKGLRQLLAEEMAKRAALESKRPSNAPSRGYDGESVGRRSSGRGKLRGNEEEEQARRDEEEYERVAERERRKYTARKRERREKDEEEDDAPPPPRRKRCEDLHEECPTWAEDGECHSNKAYMQKHCRKSCKLCRRERERD
eukprot:TRINITY_DN7758_c0_g2_i1.p1 TRINITY_DN7758_c0_g2~~TRINITY_DN7758_c0_g2_i1.p1  ORF type:complete len:311 (+),score=58.17 TRINITY_DN7758_c0_g2_i1:89-1021(+)